MEKCKLLVLFDTELLNLFFTSSQRGGYRHWHLRVVADSLLLGHRHRHSTLFALCVFQGKKDVFGNRSLVRSIDPFSSQVVQEYERAVIFRLGRLLDGGSKGPGKW